MATILKSNQYLEAPITDPKHLVNKEYVDDLVNRNTKQPVRVATTINLVGTYDGTAQTITASNPAAIVIDGVTLAVGDRILIKDQTDGTQNGIYDVTDTGTTTTPFVLKRSSDFNSSDKITRNLFIRVSEGNNQADLLFQLINDGTIILDTTALVFLKYGGGGGSGIGKVAFDIIGNDTDVSFPITHNLNTTDINVNMKSGDDIILSDWRSTSANAIEVTFDLPLPTGTTIRVIIIG